MNGPSPGFDLTPENPWPGLQSFTEDGKEFFFGREEETESVFRLVKRERLTVFYGQSGLGKSSLLCAGLFPKLRPLNLLPVPLRLDYSDPAPPLDEQVKQSLVAAFRLNQIAARPPETGESLWAYFHRQDLEFRDARKRLVTPVLVFDQFEERFTLGRRNEQVEARAEEFLTGLSQLVENRPPPGLRATFDTNPDTALAYDFDKQACKVILSLREDFLPELDEMGGLFPSITTNRFRLLPMARRQALEVVRQPGPTLVSEEVAAAIVDFVAFSRQQRAGGEVEPALLSLVLQELNALRQKHGHAQISADLLSGSKDKILEDFYEQAVKNLPARVRTFLEEGLLTSSGYRDSIALEDARSEFGLDDATLAALVNLHLVRREERLGSTRLELVHDLLTKVITQSRQRRKEQERLKDLYEQEWRQNNATAVRVALWINSVAADWNRNRKTGAELLLRGPHLSQATELLEKYPSLLNPEGHDFIEESQPRRRRGLILWVMVSSLLFGFCVLAFVSIKNRKLNRDTFLELGVLVILFVIPSILLMVDKCVVRLRLKTLAGSAWRWSLYGWIMFLLACIATLNPSDYGEFTAGLFIFGVFLLIPYFKWKPYREACRLALQPVNRMRLGPKMALAITTALIPSLYILSGIAPNIFYNVKHGSQGSMATGRTPASTITSYTNYVEESTKRMIVRIQNTDKLLDGKITVDTYFTPGTNDGGYYKSIEKTDEKGNQTEWACFDMEGNPQIDKSKGYHMFRTAYDKHGNWTNEVYLGVDGQPTLTRKGYSRITSKWDERGNRIEWACFGTNGEPALYPSGGYHKIKDAYNKHGDWTNEAYFGMDDQPTMMANGYASMTAKWNDRGKQTEWACFDKEGRPFIGKYYGYYMSRTAYDERGNWTNVTYLGTNGELMLVDGYARTAAQWDTRGNQTDWAYFGTNGEPVSCDDGYQRRRVEYGSDGKIISDKRFDAQGNPVVQSESAELVISIAEVVAGGQAAAVGLQKGDIVWGYDDWDFVRYPATNDTNVIAKIDAELINRIFASGNTKRRLMVVRDGEMKTFEVPPGRLGVRLVYLEKTMPKQLLTPSSPLGNP